MVNLHKQDIQSEGKNGSATKVTEIQRHAELAAKYLKAWAVFEQDTPTRQAKHGAKARDAKAEEERQRIEEERREVEEERRAEGTKAERRIEEERRRNEEERLRIEEERRAEDAKAQQRTEEAKQQADEIQRLQKIIAELQAKSTAA